MGCIQWLDNDIAVTPVIGTILILVIVSTAITFVLVWGGSYIEHAQMDASFESVYAQFSLFDETLRDLIYGGPNASRENNLAIDEGQITIDSKGIRMVIMYSLNRNYDFVLSDFDDDDDTSFTIKALGGSITGAHVFWMMNDSEKNISVNGDTVSAPWDLVNMIRIDFYHSNTLIGRSWVFDVGCITYELPSSFGTYQMTAENNGVVATSPGGSFVRKEPVVYEENNALVLRITQIKPIDFSGGSGAGTYRFITRLQGSRVRESAVTVYKVKMQVYGDTSEAWLRYFDRECNFNEYTDGVDNTLEYEKTGVLLTLTHSIIKTSLRGIE